MNDNKPITKPQQSDEKLERLLFEFVERAVKKGATPEEIAVLPEVARVLMDINRY